jgi:hypothetical protein
VVVTKAGGWGGKIEQRGGNKPRKHGYRVQAPDIGPACVKYAVWGYKTCRVRWYQRLRWYDAGLERSSGAGHLARKAENRASQAQFRSGVPKGQRGLLRRSMGRGR